MSKLVIEVQLFQNGKGRDIGHPIGPYQGELEVTLFDPATQTAIEQPIQGGYAGFDNLKAGEYLVILPTRDAGQTAEAVVTFIAPWNGKVIPPTGKYFQLAEDENMTVQAGLWHIEEQEEGHPDPSDADNTKSSSSAPASEVEAITRRGPLNVQIACTTCSNRYYTPGTPYYLNYPAYQQCLYNPPCT